MRTIPELNEGTHRAKATGTLPNGKPVIVNADGTVSVIGPGVASLGSEVTFEDARVSYLSSTFDSNSNKVVMAYQDDENSDYGTAIVGTVSGTSITFGSPAVFNTAGVLGTYITFDSNSNKVVIAYRDGSNSGYGTAIVGTVSGTSISFGTKNVFESANSFDFSLTFDSNSNKVVIVYQDIGNSRYGTAIVATVSGTSISFGSPAVFNTAHTVYTSASFDSSSNKVVIAYKDLGNTTHGKAIVATVSGTSISFGSATVFQSASSDWISSAFDSTNNKVVIAYKNAGNSNYGTAIVGTVSGTSISFGTPAVFESASTSYTSTTFDSNEGIIVIGYRDDGNSNSATLNVGTVSGTSISFGSPITSDAEAVYTQVTFDSNSNKTVLSYEKNNDSGVSSVYSPAPSSNLTSENYIGMSQGFAESLITSKGTSVVFESGRSSIIDSTFDSTNNKIVIAYCDNDNSSYGTAIVGTVSGTGISFGTPVVFKSATLQDPIKITYDSTKDRIVIIYKNASSGDDGEVIVGDVSGTSITFGSSVVFESGLMNGGDVVYASNAQRILVSYKDELTSNNGFCCVVSIGGTGDLVPTVNSRQTFNAASTDYISSVYDSTNQKVVILFRDNGDSSKGKAIVATVGSTSVTFGSEAEFSASTTNVTTASFDSNSGKVIVAYKDEGNSGYGTAIVGTVSGTSISFGSATVFEEASTVSLSSAFDSNLNKVVISYRDTGNSDAGTLAAGTVSGTSISFDTPFVFEGEVYNSTSVTFDSNSDKIVASFNDDDTNRIGTSAVITLGFENRGQVNAGSSATIDIIGSISTNQGGLTAGQSYYVQTDGTIGETPADPSVFAGTAISATSLVVKT